MSPEVSAQIENKSLVYHQNVNLANRSLMKCDNKEASAHFDNVFQPLESPFFIDYIKSILSKFEIGAAEEAKQQIIRVINEKHIPYNKFKMLLPLDKFSKSDIKSFKSLCEVSAKGINELLSSELKD